MIQESGIRLRSIKDKHVAGLLKSPRWLRWFFGMDMANAQWIPQEGFGSQLILAMRIPSRLQGWFDIIHGGGADFVLHDVAGVAALVHARRHNKVVLGHSIEVVYERPLPLRSSARVIATIDGQEDGDILRTLGEIRFIDPRDGTEKVHAHGVLRVKEVDEIRYALRPHHGHR